MNNKGKFTILTFIFVCLFTSCIDDDLIGCIDDSDILEFTNDYSLNLTVTLDNMGGTRSVNTPNALKEREDYIDPEKFRVLFFDSNEKFLFESKSRWIKRLATDANGNSQWLVSIPMYAYGNDAGENWPWEDIRGKLKNEKFKIAILANRPRKEWCPSFDGIIDETWFDNEGPYWDKNDIGVRSIFDLHHCQPDPIYHGKSTSNGYYDFISGPEMEGDQGKHAAMGATSSWVAWDYPGSNGKNLVTLQDLDPDIPHTTSDNVRYTILPSSQHPIPMYGIQEFDPITTWVKGMPFNLSKITTGSEQTGYNFKSIALLRSVVKLELMLSKKSFPTKPKFVTLWYPNIYARCEPMNVWDSTEEIWKREHKNEQDCEMYKIMQYGPIWSTKSTFPNRTVITGDTKGSIKNYQKTLSWFYGAWLGYGSDGKARWDFSTYSTNNFKNTDVVRTDFTPQIFNPCIQRNKLVVCSIGKDGKIEGNDKDEPREGGDGGDVNYLYPENDEYWHFIVYTGERNMIDPNTLPYSSNAYAEQWIFKSEDVTNNYKYYAIPIANYDIANNTAKNCFGPYNKFYLSSNNTTLNFPVESENNVDNNKDHIYVYGNTIRDNVTDTEEMPWPLLRNHVYRIKVESLPTRGVGEDILVGSEEFHSESLKIE